MVNVDDFDGVLIPQHVTVGPTHNRSFLEIDRALVVSVVQPSSINLGIGHR